MKRRADRSHLELKVCERRRAANGGIHPQAQLMLMDLHASMAHECKSFGLGSSQRLAVCTAYKPGSASRLCTFQPNMYIRCWSVRKPCTPHNERPFHKA